MAISGVVGMPTTRIVPYGAEAMTGAAGQLFEDFGVDIEPEEFKVAEPPEFQADEEAMAKQVVDEVEAFWKSLGLNFPREAIDLRF
ncbi:hypothetical protein [Solemya pervernicosa gill symbiont]|nr:hypothetical protein [Solemya pervernicosa gill symbiont]